MIWLDIIRIITRIFFGLSSVGCVLSLFLHEKHQIFKKMFIFTGVFALWYGIGKMFMFAILGT